MHPTYIGSAQLRPDGTSGACPAWRRAAAGCRASRSSTTCQGGRHRRAHNDWAHNRFIGQCCDPYDEAEICECDACMITDRAIVMVIFGKCRHAAVPSRRSALTVEHQLRAPAAPSHSDRTAGPPSHARGQHDRREKLGVKDEEAALKRAAPIGTGSASSSGPNGSAI